MFMMLLKFNGKYFDLIIIDLIDFGTTDKYLFMV